MDPRARQFFEPGAAAREVGPATQKLRGVETGERGYGFALKAAMVAGFALSLSAAPVRAQVFPEPQFGPAAVHIKPGSVDLDQSDTSSIWINPQTGKLYAPVAGSDEAVVVNRGALAEILVQAGALPQAPSDVQASAAQTMEGDTPASQASDTAHSIWVHPGTNQQYGSAPEGGDGVIVNRAAVTRLLQAIGNTPEIDDEPIVAPKPGSSVSQAKPSAFDQAQVVAASYLQASSGVAPRKPAPRMAL